VQRQRAQAVTGSRREPRDDREDFGRAARIALEIDYPRRCTTPCASRTWGSP
jgi:hypothetical protein